jgi:pilus assembly protein Flp/PilA
MKGLLYRVRADVSGAMAVEYALIAALISLVIVTALTLLGASMLGVFQTISGAVQTAGGS